MAADEGYVLQIKKIGNSTGLILPKELLARLKLGEGDKLHVIEQTERGLKLSPYDPKHAKAMEIAAAVIPQICRYLSSLGEMNEPEWLDIDIVLDFHAEQLALFGGADGSARPSGFWNPRWRDRATSSLMVKSISAALAAAYGFGIARNHPFVDGNKRTAFAAMIVFLGLNKFDLEAPQEAATAIVLGLAAGEVTEKVLAAWITDHVKSLDAPGIAPNVPYRLATHN